MKLLMTIGNYNPAGIVINEGWIALAAAICGLSAEDALHKICGIRPGGEYRRRGGCGKTEKILKLFKENPDLHNSEIAEKVGCTREMVRIVLKRHGVPRRNRWDGHISFDPRYYKKHLDTRKKGNR